MVYKPTNITGGGTTLQSLQFWRILQVFLASPSLLLRIPGEASLWFNLQSAVFFSIIDLDSNIPSVAQIQFFSGWWFQPLRKILVSWDDDIPNIWKNKIHVPNHQSASFFVVYNTIHLLKLLVTFFLSRTQNCQSHHHSPICIHMLHGAGIFTYINTQKSPSFVGVYIPAPWFASGGLSTSKSSQSTTLDPQRLLKKCHRSS